VNRVDTGVQFCMLSGDTDGSCKGNPNSLDEQLFSQDLAGESKVNI
jgi:hypothetical protein